MFILSYLFSQSILQLSPLISFLIGTGTLILTWIAWLLCRFFYWRSGRGRKIGIVYQGLRVPLDDWAWTRNSLRRLILNGETDKQISIRLLPPKYANNEKSSQKFRDRYGVTLIISVVASPTKSDAERAIFELNISASTKAKWSKEFADATLRHSIAVLNRQRLQRTVTEALEATASSLYDLILLIAGVFDATEGNPQEAALYLGKLESRLQEIDVTQYPRLAIRWLHSRTLIAESSFGAKDSPDPDRLEEITDSCQRATDTYGSQFPDLYYYLARMRFFRNELDASVEGAEKAYQRCPSNDPAKGHAILALAVLHLFKSHFVNCRKYFAEYFSLNDWHDQNWEDLINFADYSRDVCSEHAVFIQCLYREVSGLTRASDLMKVELREWLAADASRSGLRVLYKSFEKRKRANEIQRRKSGIHDANRSSRRR